MMGSYTYAAMGMQMASFDDGGLRHFTFDYALRRLELIFVTDPLDWMIIPFHATRLLWNHNIVVNLPLRFL